MTEIAQEKRSPAIMIEQLKALLDVEEIDRDLYRGARARGSRGRVFGGQVIGQALVAASKSVDDDRPIHSLHAYFMRPGDTALPIIYRVVRDHDGGSFSTRRVIAMQRGVPILNMAASFQRPEEGLSHQFAMPVVPPPEDLISEEQHFRTHIDQVPESMRDWVLRPRHIELRPVQQRFPIEMRSHEPVQQTWFRAVAPLGDDPLVHRATLAFASDMVLLGTSMIPHDVDWMKPDLQSASLDHSLWLHDVFRADDWLLYATDSPWAGHARGFNRGSIFTREGRLVASVAQEGLVRLRKS
ncbi:acyl-CoA thioesterase [Sphingobium boeckii]|uniref:Acyl-CoA thioesterase 2 n=1 Tax=Sphingobium boeckii TaxID=1082345 RepID=A0A7W9EGC8_9SPHN|nr:acyl-CoA thioesterase II [Sphingobium boeckii]MBB5686586.1 acyl-CoA thioesterase-2 [Sphingobium boeckii]